MRKVFILAISLIVMMLNIGVTFAEEKCLIMGLIPAEDPKAMMEQYTPMKNWLEKEMKRCIKLFTATDYTGVIEAMRAKKIDFAWFGPFSYVLANERAGAEAFAVGIGANGKTTYRAYLVATPEVAQKLDISTPLEGEQGMKVLKEKLNNFKKQFTFAFTDTASTSGYAVPRYFMYKVNLDPDLLFKKVGFVGTHDAAEFSIKNKTIDIVADNDVTYSKMIGEGKISKETNIVIWQSPELPGSPMAFRKDLPNDVKAALKDHIVKVPQNIVAGYGKITGYKLVSDEDYAIIKDVKKVIDTLK